MNKESFKSRVARGWGIVKNSWSVIRSAKILLLVPLLGFLINVLILVGLFMFGFRTEISGTFDSWGVYPKFDAISIVSLFIAYALMTISNTFFTGVASHNVLARFNGEPTPLASSFKAAWQKKKDLILFGLVSSLIGYILAMITERLPFASKLIAWVGEVSWTAASFFAIPLIMMHTGENVSPKRAVKESSVTLKKLWKEGISSQLSIGFIMLVTIVLVYALLVLMMQLLYTISGSTDGVPIVVGMASFAVIILGILSVILVFNLLGLIARCALLHYGQTKKDPEQYNLSIMRAGMTADKAKKLFL